MSSEKVVADWLNAKFLEWSQQHGRRKTLREFAAWLGVKEGILGHWMAGRNNPTGDNVALVASKLGPEIYDLLGLARPDPLTIAITKRLDSLPHNGRSEIQEAIDQGASDNEVHWRVIRAMLGQAELSQEQIEALAEDSLERILDSMRRLSVEDRETILRLVLMRLTGQTSNAASEKTNEANVSGKAKSTRRT